MSYWRSDLLSRLQKCLFLQPLRYVQIFIHGGKRRLRYRLYACGKNFSHASESCAYLILNENTTFAKGSIDIFKIEK